MSRIGSCCFASLLCGILLAQDSSKPPSPPAAYVSSAEISQAVKQVPVSGTKDAVLRVVPVRGEYNVGVSVVRRTRVKGKTVPDALVHHAITEVYEVTAGCGTLVTGGSLVNGKELAADDPDVRSQIGPTAQGTEIKAGSPQKISPGDVVVIPEETPHGFSEICEQGITYLLVRVDNRRVLQPSAGGRKPR